MTLDTTMIENNWPLSEVKIGKTLSSTSDKRIVAKLDTAQGKFVYKIADEWKSEEILSKELLVYDLLPHEGFNNIAKLVKSKSNELFTNFNGKRTYVLEFVEGVQPKPTPETYTKLGNITAQLHQIKEYPHRTQFDPTVIIKHLQDLAEKLPFKDEYLKLVLNLPSFSDLHQALIHTDISPGNAIEKPNGEIVLVDWDDAGVGTRVLDVAFPLIQQFVSEDCKFSKINARAFYKAYLSKIKLERNELDCLFDAALFIALKYIIYGDTSKRWQRINWALNNKSALEDTYRS